MWEFDSSIPAVLANNKIKSLYSDGAGGWSAPALGCRRRRRRRRRRRKRSLVW